MFNQTKSVTTIKEKILSVFNERFPMELADGYSVNVSNITFTEPSTDFNAQSKAFLDEDDIKMVVKADLLVTKNGEKEFERKQVVFAAVPYPTERGTYVVKGNENVIINQMLLRPGIYVNRKKQLSDDTFIPAEIRAGRNRFTINFSETSGKLVVEGLRLKYGFSPKKLDGLGLLELLGVTHSELRNAVGDDEIFQLIQKNSPKNAKERVFKSLFGLEYNEVENPEQMVQEAMQNRLKFDEKAKKVTNITVGQTFDAVDKNAILLTVSKMFEEYRNPGSSPNIDDIRFKDFHSPEDIIARYVDKGIDGWQRKVSETIRFKKVKGSSSFVPSGYVQKSMKDLFSSSLMENVSSGNALDVFQLQNKVTMGGPDGLNERSVTNAARALQDTAFAKLDPVETPQSLSLGIAQHIAKDTEVRNNTLYSKYYRVKNGVVDTSKIVNDIDPIDEYEEYVAFHIPAVLDKTKKNWTFKEKEVRARYRGDFVTVPVEKITLLDKSPSSHVGNATGLVPFSAHNDGSRMLMGASMQRQALPLADPDEPLVQSIEEDGETLEKKIAENVSYLLKSPINGTVSDIQDDYIEITNAAGQKERIKKLNYYAAGTTGGYIHHKPVVKIGDKVREGDLLADGWQSKNGKLALGKNARVAFMPFKGYNFEDGLAVSESFANKMASEEIKILDYEVFYDDITVPKEETKQRLKELLVSDGILRKLDDRGVIRKGEEIVKGDILVGLVKLRKKAEASAAEKLLKRAIIDTPKDTYVNRSYVAEGYQKGKVVDVQVSETAESMKVMIKLLSFKPMQPGDKLSGRHGNKGTITKILPDNEMPHTEDGRPVEVIFSPLAVPSRKNVGQLLEVNAGLVAEKKGLPAYAIQNFDKSERDKLMKELEEVGVPDGKVKLINPDTGKPYENPVTVGPMYMLKLEHKAEGKISGRHYVGDKDPITDMPKKSAGAADGDRRSPQGVGGMEFWSLTSAGAANNILEMTTLKSDGAGLNKDKLAKFKIYEALKYGTKIPEPVTPQTLHVLQDQLLGAGLQITPLKDDKEVTMDEKFTSLMLSPISKKKIEELAPRSVTSSKTFNALNKKEDPKGLYSKEIFGEKHDKWGKIDLGTPIPNPVFMQNTGGAVLPYEAMLLSKGLTQNDISKIVENGQYIVLDPKDSGFERFQILTPEEVEEAEIMDDKEFTYATGADALNKLLEDVDLKNELTLAEEKLRSAKDVKERSKAQRQVKVLAGALDKGAKPQDFLLPFVPVLPMKYREPVKANASDRLAEDGITLLYQNLLKKTEEFNTALEKNQGDRTNFDKKVLADLERDRYEIVRNIVGVGDAYKDKTRNIEYEGIMHRLSAKDGFIRDKMEKKLQDYSGRSVIIGDPEISLDEVKLPEDMAAEIFRPKIEGELLKRNYSREQIKDAFETRNEGFRNALSKVAENEVVLLNRQPSLHRHSIQAFKPLINWNGADRPNRAIGLNPLVTTGFNADYDGDSMAVHVPITEAAKKEAIEKLMPSKNLLNPTSNSFIMELKHEMQLGLYYMTRDRIPQNGFKEFKNVKELEKAYKKGEIQTYDGVRVNIPMKGTVTSTAGKVLFNSVLPPSLMDFEKNVNMKKKDIEELLMKVIENPKYGTMRAVQILNAWKNIGFEAATMSGVSIGVKDFAPVASIDKDSLFNEAEKNVSAANYIDKLDEFETEKSKFVADRVKDMIQNQNVLGEDNPVEIMRASGARGNAGQIQSMGVFVGHGQTVDGKLTRPVKSSLLEGLNPDEFWDLSNDSRKGIYDRSVATRDPGALTRDLWMSNKQTIIIEKDCGDRQGIVLNMNIDHDRKGLYGRILLEDVNLKNGKGIVKAKKGVPLTRQEVEKIRTEAQNPERIKVRSPLSCKSKNGICQYCYGMKPGAMNNELVPIGEAVGSIAAQAIGEPSQQAIMKTFHTGSAQNSVSSGFIAINNALKLTELPDDAVLAERAGVVKKIETNNITGTTIKIGNKTYKLGNKPKHPDIVEGTKVEVGTPLTDLGATKMTTKQILQFQGPDAAKAHLTNQLEEAFKAGGTDFVDRRHTEVVVNNITNRADVVDGGTSNLMPGQKTTLKGIQSFNTGSRVVDVPMTYTNRMNVIGAKAALDYSDLTTGRKIVGKGEVITEDIWNKLHAGGRRKFVKVTKENVKFTPSLSSISEGTKNINDNWLEHAGYNDVRRGLGDHAATFAVDQLDNPLTRQMTGLKGNFGDGFKSWMDGMKNKFGDIFM